MLCLVFLEVGCVFLYLTKAIAWRNSFSVFLKIMKDDPSSSGERTVSHRKAFLSTVAATVGIGNIAGVGTAIHIGGPGALFWMWMSALFGMSFRMASTYMAIKLRPEDDSSKSFATPMVYLEKYMTGRFRMIPHLVAGLILIQGLVLYNLVQANSVAQAVHNRFDVSNWVTAILLTVFVGMVILGGMKKIVNYSSVFAPFMISIYVISGLAILLSSPIQTLSTLGQVFYYAFTPYSLAGGVVGYTVFQAMQFGVSRGVFSHMSGMGTSTFLQGANKEAPAVGAFMSALTPFVDTVIICSVTGLVILSGPFWQVQTGAHLTADSFEAGLGFVGQIIVIASLIIFAFTTISAFAHISERCLGYLGSNNTFYYRLAFLVVTFIGPFLDLRFVWSLSDIIIALIVIFHLIPLLYITLLNRKEMCRDLKELSSGYSLDKKKNKESLRNKGYSRYVGRKKMVKTKR